LFNAILDKFLRIADRYFCLPGYLPLKSLGLVSLIANKSANVLLDLSKEIHRYSLCVICIHFLSPRCRTTETKAHCMLPVKLESARWKKRSITRNSIP
jgi:hypothetical protein